MTLKCALKLLIVKDRVFYALQLSSGDGRETLRVGMGTEAASAGRHVPRGQAFVMRSRIIVGISRPYLCPCHSLSLSKTVSVDL